MKQKFAAGVWEGCQAASSKYPDLTIQEEIALDWFLDWMMRYGRIPLRWEAKWYLSLTAIFNRLAEKGYLDVAWHTHKPMFNSGWIGKKVTEVPIKVLYGKVYVGPIPRRLTKKQAMLLGQRIYHEAVEAGKGKPKRKRRR